MSLISVLRNLRVLSLAVVIAAVWVFAVACSENESADPQHETGRVPVRHFQLLPDSPLADANFSAVLPEGWGSVDTLEMPLRRLNAPPEGVMAKLGASSSQVHYAITPPGPMEEFWVPPGHERRETVIDGATVQWALPSDPFDGGEHHRFNVHFSAVPGDEGRRFGLSVLASGLNGPEYREVMQIVESIRHAPPPEPMQPPEPQVTPGPDWQRVEAQWRGDREARFSLLAPPGTTFDPSLGYDSFTGTFTIGEIEIALEYGANWSPSVASPDSHLRFEDEVEHQYWVEVIDGKSFAMYRPANEDPPGRAYTGISVARLPGLPDLVTPDGSYSTSDVACGGVFFASNIDRNQQEVVLAVLRTIRAESAPSWCD